MGLDGMRVGSGRCPPLFVGGLLLSCLLLVCNWWSLSNENLELLRQIDEISEQLKITADDRDQCSARKIDIQKSLKQSEDDVASLHVRLQQTNELKAQKGRVEESLAICNTELESLKTLDATKSATLDSLRSEKDTLATQLDAKTDESQQLKKDLAVAVNDVQKLRLLIDHQPEKEKQMKEDSPLQLAQGLTRSDKLGQLPLVAESAVNISSPGKNGIEYHGIPILPKDPPGAVRQKPRFSVTLWKAPTSEPSKGKIPTEGDGNEDDGNAAEGETSGLDKRFNPPDDISNLKNLDEAR